MSIIALLLIILKRSGTSTNPRSFSTGAFFNILLLIFSFTRTFFLTSEGYAESYASYSFRLWGSVVKLFGGSIPFQENPLDRGIASLSFVFAVGFLIFVAILSARFVVKRNFDPFSSAISLVFIITLAVPVSAYVVLKTQESGPLHDFGSATALARSMAPLVIIMMAPHFRNIGRINFPFKRLFLALVVIGLSLIVLFAPFIFLRGDVKSVYDMRQIAGDASEYTILGNHVYEFVISHRPIESKIRISSSATVSFLRLYEFLPLQYRTGGRVEIGYVNMTLESRTYDSGMFTVSISQTEQSTLFMNELEFAEH
jgi:hypothetical protein